MSDQPLNMRGFRPGTDQASEVSCPHHHHLICWHPVGYPLDKWGPKVEQAMEAWWRWHQRCKPDGGQPHRFKEWWPDD